MSQTDAKGTQAMVQFAIRMPVELRDLINALAQQDRRSPSQWARIVLEDYAKEQA